MSHPGGGLDPLEQGDGSVKQQQQQEGRDWKEAMGGLVGCLFSGSIVEIMG